MKLKELLFMLDGKFEIHITDGNDWRDLDQDDSMANIRQFFDKAVTRICASESVCHVYVE